MSCISLLHAAVLLLFACPLTAQYMFEIYQDTWEDGPGNPGPHTSDVSWGEGFDTCSVVDWWSEPGELSMGLVFMNQPDSTVIEDWFRPSIIEVVDIDDDGDSDALTVEYYESRILAFENVAGTGEEWDTDTVACMTESISCLGTGDLNGNGLADVVAADWIPGDVYWFENPGGPGTWAEHQIVTGIDNPRAIEIFDPDGDGDQDLLIASYSDDGLILMINNDGQGTSWNQQQLAAPDPCCHDIATGDIDGDGDTDVVALYSNENDVRWWENQGGGSWQMHTIDSNFPDAGCVHVADADGDGDNDVAASGWAVCLWYNQGSGTGWTEQLVDEDYSAYPLNSLDVDGDGDLDLMGSVSGYESFIAVWEQSGDTWIRRTIFPGGDPIESRFSDMDGDGTPDITTGWWLPENRIAWYEFTTCGALGWLESTVLELMIPTDYPMVEWGVLQWTADTPPGTAVMFQARAGMEFVNLGPWSDYITVPGTIIEGLITNDASYAQYRVTLVSTDPDTFPTLDQMMLSYTPLGGGVEMEGEEEPGLYTNGPNPCLGAPVLECIIGQAGPVDLRVWDMAGRLVSNPLNSTQLNPGSHLVQLGDLNPGIYFCRLISGDLNETLRLVVID